MQLIIETRLLYGIQFASHVLLFLLGCAAFYHMLISLPVRKRRWRSLKEAIFARKGTLPVPIQKLLFIKANKLEEKKQLLQGCGLAWDAAFYEGLRRLTILTLLITILVAYAAFRYQSLAVFVNPVYVLTGSVSVLIVVWFDKKVLAGIKGNRAHRIVKEIYVISHHLLYYCDSQMNLHAKLSRCFAQTRTVRAQCQLLLNEWYQDAEAAIQHFKQRLGTDEAYSFAETLNAMRLNENEGYYELLKQRIQDYKEKMEMVRESRKETVSYLLFILAGLPILNTFRVFMYPWIVEGQRLFNSIN